MGSIGRLVRTVRHYQAGQLAYWVLRRVRGAWKTRWPRAEVSWSPARADRMAAVVASWPRDTDAQRAEADRILRGSFEFFGQRLDAMQPDWSRQYFTRLWSYQLHYFRWLESLMATAADSGRDDYARRASELVTGWLNAVHQSPGIAFDEYVTAHRTIAWMRVLTAYGSLLDEALRRRMVASLGTQLTLLERRPELHLRGNHLQKDYTALVWGGWCLDGQAPTRWRTHHPEMLWREVMTQVHPDGGHAERSPMYHGEALSDVAELVLLARAIGEPVPEGVKVRCAAMRDALALLRRPSGEFHPLNDTAGGMTADPDIIAQLAASAFGGGGRATGPFALPHMGFHGWLSPDGQEKIILDTGAPAPAHQPAHAHAAALTFELCFSGHPVIVDSGVAGYAGDPLREYVRSTRAHNTVSVDGQDQSETWGTFRLGGRAIVETVEHDGDSAVYWCRCRVRPFHRGRVRHERTVRREGSEWMIQDVVSSVVPVIARTYWHFGPDFAVRSDGEGVEAVGAAGTLVLRLTGMAGWRLVTGSTDPVQGWYCAAFGKAQPATVVEVLGALARESHFEARLRWQASH